MEDSKKLSAYAPKQEENKTQTKRKPDFEVFDTKPSPDSNRNIADFSKQLGAVWKQNGKRGEYLYIKMKDGKEMYALKPFEKK